MSHPSEAVIEAHGLYKIFGDAHPFRGSSQPTRAVDGLDLRVQPGEVYGLLGPNGSGKTTLIRLIVGLLRATEGSIRVLGKTMPDKSVLAQIGYMTQASALYEDLTIRENVAFFASMSGAGRTAARENGLRDRRLQQRIDEVIELVDLSERARSVVRTLSGGMKQRASLACTLVHRPRLLLLDEPTVGVDPQQRVVFWRHFRMLAADGVTLLVSSHVMDEAERCDRLGFMRQGRLLAEGSAQELRRQAGTATLEEAFLAFADSPPADVQSPRQQSVTGGVEVSQ